MYGWVGQILRVNLSDGTVKKEALDPVEIKNYIGARGLGTRLWTKECDPKMDPLSEANNLIFMTGPLTGTMATNAGRYNVICKAPLTGAMAASNSGGYWGPELKYAGYDGIILEGQSEKPVYLWINDGEVELRCAEHLWGKDVNETTDTLREETNIDARVACIGPAGENLVKFACVLNDYTRAAGRSGVGAVMGSKNLKAVVVRGTGGVKVARRLTNGIRVDEDSLALDVIENVGPGGRFGNEEHTAEHIEDNFVPRLVNRAAREIWEKAGSKTLTQVANEKVRDIINHHEPDPLPKDIAAQIRDIVENAVGHMPGED